MTARKKTPIKAPHYPRSGWALIVIGMLMHTVLTILNTMLHRVQWINTKDNVVEHMEVNISGYALGIPSIMILCGLILIMHGPLGELISKWRKK